MYSSPQLSAVTMKDLDSKKPAKYADSSISDKAFKNMIIWFAIYCGLFCIGVISLSVPIKTTYSNKNPKFVALI